MTFGDFFRAKRSLREPSLRRFCEKHGLDPGNISKMERSLVTPPQNDAKLKELATILGIKKESADFRKLLSLAAEGAEASRFQSLFHNISDKKLIQRLPALIKSLDSAKLTEQKLNKLIEIAST